MIEKILLIVMGGGAACLVVSLISGLSFTLPWEEYRKLKDAGERVLASLVLAHMFVLAAMLLAMIAYAIGGRKGWW